MSKVPETYLYEVRNIGRTIKLDCGTEITTPRSLYLTKDDVKKCLETAYIFRRFAEHGPERVTKVNLDRMHNPKFISEQEWKAMQTEIVEDTTIEEASVEPEVAVEVVEDVVSEPVDDKNEKPEEVAELTSVLEESNQDILVESETVNADVEEEDIELVEDDSEIVTEDRKDDVEIVVDLVEDNGVGEVPEESENQQTQTNTVKYHYKKHNKNKH